MDQVMKIIQTDIPSLFVVETTPYADVRGAFARLYCERELSQLIGERQIVQVNHSRTNTVGAIRGMHFQFSPYAEMKLVRCVKGRVWDVVVDLRQNSTSFLQWHAEELSSNNARMVVIPEGFAHGFQVIEPDSELLYLHTAFYNPEAEGGLRYDDPLLGIRWPLTVTDISARDSSHCHIDSKFQGFAL